MSTFQLSKIVTVNVFQMGVIMIYFIIYLYLQRNKGGRKGLNDKV